MLIVAGHLIVDGEIRDRRDDYVAGCAPVVRQARNATGCLDFAISADLLDPMRVNIFERWQSRDALAAFRGDGPSGEQADAVVAMSVCEYEVSGEHRLG